MPMLSKQRGVYEAARRLMVMAVDLELEDDGDDGPHASLPSDQNVESLVGMILNDHIDDVMLTMGTIIGQIEHAWEHDIGLVFHHMGYGDDMHGTILYYLIMGCLGHGIGIGDDYSNELDAAGKILLNIGEDTGKRFDESPVYLDAGNPIQELISFHLCYEDKE